MGAAFPVPLVAVPFAVPEAAGAKRGADAVSLLAVVPLSWLLLEEIKRNVKDCR